MKGKVLALLVLINSSYASTINHHPSVSPNSNNLPGCEIEIINKSSVYVNVYGTFDDGVPMVPFTVMPDNMPRYIDLLFNGYCHQTMYLDIADANGLHVYTKYTTVNTQIKLLPALKGSIKAVTL